MLRNGIKRENNLTKQTANIGISKTFDQQGSSSDSYDLQSPKEFNHISHTATADRKRAPFATTLKNPYWDESYLWKDAFLVYSYKHPEDCLGPPVNKNDKTIRFNSRFESGNLLYAYRLNPDVYHCILEYDHSTAAQCQWFYFQMTNIKTIPNSNRKMTFYISGFNKATGVFSTGSKVFMYSEKLAKEKNIGWFRTGTNYAYGTISSKSDESSFLDYETESSRRKKGKSKVHKYKRSTLQFQITFPYDDDVVYLCYAQPYTYTDLNSYITNWIRTSPSLITKSNLCKTNGGKDCPLLTITAPNSTAASKKKCIFITARIHPGEPNGSIVLHGLIDYLLSKQPLSNYLLDHFIFKIVPMVNIDGVIEGFYRVGLEGEDLNRVWNQPDPRKHPVVYHTKSLLHEMNKKMGIAAYIDFHGHSREHGTFAYGCPWEENENLPTSMINKEKILPKIVASLCDAFSFEKCVFSIPQKRKDASRCVVRREMGVINSFTIESSFGGITSGLWGNTLYNEFIWKEIGAKIGEGLFHLFSDPSSQTLKTAEKAIAALATMKPVVNQMEIQTIKEKPIVKKKTNISKSNREENKIVIAIDTQDGIKVISTEKNAPANSSSNIQTIKNNDNNNNNNSTLKLNNSGTIIQKVEQNPVIETIYTLKIADLSSYSSSSCASSARVKRNPRINMNKKLNLNSTLNNNNNNNNSESKQYQISVSNSTDANNSNQNRRSNLSQRSNVSLCSISRLNEKISSSSSHQNLDKEPNPPLKTNVNKIVVSNSISKVTEIQTSNSSLIDTSFENTNNNSILIPSETPNTNQNQNQTANSTENQKSTSGAKARLNRISKSSSTSNTNTNTASNPNSNSNSESSQNANAKSGSDLISNKIIKPNTNSTRNSNSGSVTKTKLISKPNTNATTKVSIILNPNSPPNSNANSTANYAPNPPPNHSQSSNRNENQKLNPTPPSSAPVNVHPPATPAAKDSSNKPPQHPISNDRPIQTQNSNTTKTEQTTTNIKQSAPQPQKQNNPPPTSSKIAADAKQTPTPTTKNTSVKQNPPQNPATNQNTNPTPPSTATNNNVNNAKSNVVTSQNTKPTPSSTSTNNNAKSNTVTSQNTKPTPPSTTTNNNAKSNTVTSQDIKPTPPSTTTTNNNVNNVKSNNATSQNAKPTPPSTTSTTTNNNSVKFNNATSQNTKQTPPSTTTNNNVKSNTATNQNTKPTQPSNIVADAKPTPPPTAAPTKNADVKPSSTTNQNTNPVPPSTTQNSNAKPNQTTNQNPVQPSSTSTKNSKPNQPQNTTTNVASNQNNASKQNQPSTPTTKSSTTNQNNASKPNQPSNSTPNVKQTPQTNTTKQNPTPQSIKTTTTNQNQSMNQKTNPIQNTPTKINQSQSLNKTELNPKSISNSNSTSKVVQEMKQKPPTGNPQPNPRMNHITHAAPESKAPINFEDYEFSSNSYLSSQSDSNSFSFLNQEFMYSETNLFNCSTATFNSSSTYKSPTKSPKSSSQEKSIQKAQQPKKPQSSRSPKRK